MPLDPKQNRLDREAAAAKKTATRPTLEPEFPYTPHPKFDPRAFNLHRDPPKPPKTAPLGPIDSPQTT